MNTILAIDTSCDETSVAITNGPTVLSNVIWSQANQHAQFGGVLPSLAQRAHEERIDWVVNKALIKASCVIDNIDCFAVTAGPGLAIALGVGIKKAKELATKYTKPLVGINHIEGHILSSLARPQRVINKENKVEEHDAIEFPAWSLVISGGHTELVYIKEIGKYEIVAQTLDDALGEALDKAARMLGLGYPGGALLEKLARDGQANKYMLPLPMTGREGRNAYSYSGLKTAFMRLVKDEKQPALNKQAISDLAAGFQNRAFEHLIRVTKKSIEAENKVAKDMLVGGGVVANVELRNRLRQMGKELGIKMRFPYSNKLIGDNAAMIGVAAGYNNQTSDFVYKQIEAIDRKPRWSIEDV